jgi:hypothetical protein
MTSFPAGIESILKITGTAGKEFLKRFFASIVCHFAILVNVTCAILQAIIQANRIAEVTMAVGNPSGGI